MSNTGMVQSQHRVINEDHLSTNEKGQVRVRLKNELQTPLKSMERFESTRRTWLDKAGDEQSGAADAVCGLAHKSRCALQGSSGS